MIQGLSTPYDPSTGFSSTNKRLVGCIQEITNLIQSVESTMSKDRSGLEGLIEEVKEVLESMATQTCAKLEQGDRKCITPFEEGVLM